jgi:hypothetical protein
MLTEVSLCQFCTREKGACYSPLVERRISGDLSSLGIDLKPSCREFRQSTYPALAGVLQLVRPPGKEGYSTSVLDCVNTPCGSSYPSVTSPDAIIPCKTPPRGIHSLSSCPVLHSFACGFSPRDCPKKKRPCAIVATGGWGADCSASLKTMVQRLVWPVYP